MSERYPTDEELKTIREWPHDHPNGWRGLMDFIEPILSDMGLYFTRRGMTYEIGTGGWFGNEDIIKAMQDNYIFWSICWQSSGGYYVFYLPMLIETQARRDENLVMEEAE